MTKTSPRYDTVQYHHAIDRESRYRPSYNLRTVRRTTILKTFRKWIARNEGRIDNLLKALMSGYYLLGTVAIAHNVRAGFHRHLRSQLDHPASIFKATRICISLKVFYISCRRIALWHLLDNDVPNLRSPILQMGSCSAQKREAWDHSRTFLLILPAQTGPRRRRAPPAEVSVSRAR